ncbi:hypothetical protein BVC71_02155 [Marivivens niveibacter]|uniref:Hedgehog/Intein (Hint) domain-containing protein n=2 Tax=Marivivens niveibacter TaxID=1930667 RepID=A0A251X1Z5_9RHOB|nr:hypothetical protein BVC71_02155 [Marivivens niveibacter]
MRTYEVAYLTSSGDIETFQRLAPAIPIFETAFSAFARGLVLTTRYGAVAIEDLLPGDEVRDVDGHFHELRWKGAITVVPQENQTKHLVRITADSLGPMRPSNDIMVGPAARLADGSEKAANDLIDDSGVIDITPMRPTQLFHLVFDRQCAIDAQGIALHSYHPGARHSFGLQGPRLSLFLELFPHIERWSDFGPAQSRLAKAA